MTVTVAAAGTWRLGDLTVNRLGFGAMRLTGGAVFGRIAPRLQAGAPARGRSRRSPSPSFRAARASQALGCRPGRRAAPLPAAGRRPQIVELLKN